MDLPINVGRLHHVQTQNDAEPRAIRSVMIQKREAVTCIEREMAQLAENKREIEEDLVRLGVALDQSSPKRSSQSRIHFACPWLWNCDIPYSKKTMLLHNLSYRMYADAGEGWCFAHPSYGVEHFRQIPIMVSISTFTSDGSFELGHCPLHCQ